MSWQRVSGWVFLAGQPEQAANKHYQSITGWQLKKSSNSMAPDPISTRGFTSGYRGGLPGCFADVRPLHFPLVVPARQDFQQPLI